MSAILSWQSLVFVIPLGLSAVLVGTAALGALELDVDFDLDIDADGDLDTDGAGGGLLGLLGFGRAPLAIVLMSLLSTFGATGLCLKYAVEPLVGSTTSTVLALPLSAAVAFFGAGAIARLVARWLPSTETYATDELDLLGSIGRVELTVTRDFGVCHVTDRFGTFHQIQCRTELEPLERGAAVLVTGFDPDQRTYTVEKSPL